MSTNTSTGTRQSRNWLMPSRTMRAPSRRSRALAVITIAALGLSTLVVSEARPAYAAVEEIALEAPVNDRVILGELASRSQRGEVSISGIGPYTVRGTDSRTGQPYEFVTDFNYDSSDEGWQRESDERALDPDETPTWGSNTSATFPSAGSPGSRSGVTQLTSDAWCMSPNLYDFGDGTTSYCSTFGPDVYSEPFSATVGQAVSFDWAAQRVSDDYEVYAFLVEVEEDGLDYGYGAVEDHTLIAYGRGGTQDWTTTSKEIPADGTYRFRFVNGSYDRTGGHLLGSNMFIDSIVKLGTANPIDFAPLSDKISGEGPFTVSATAPGGSVTFSSTTPGVCTVSGSTVTLEGMLGNCTVVANQAGGGDYVPAETVARSFRVLAEATAPQNVGLPLVTGTTTEGSTITADEGTWVDGGSPITGTTFQWTSTVSGTTTPIDGETSGSCVLIESAGSELRFAVTKTNSVGSTTATSTPISGYTCGTLEAPAWTDQSLGDLVRGTAVSQTFSASGVTAPTYSIAAGALPAGLDLDETTGVVSGTPTTIGPYSLTLRATNPTGTADLVVAGTVEPAMHWAKSSMDDPTYGSAFSDGVRAVSTPPPTYSVTAGALPAGLVLDPTTGAITGTPTELGTYSFEITADNGIGDLLTLAFTGDVVDPQAALAATGSSTLVPGVWMGALLMVLAGLALRRVSANR